MATKPLAIVSDAAHPTCRVYCSVRHHAWRTAYIVSGSSTSKILGHDIARCGDSVLAACGHYGTINVSTCSSFIKDENLEVALVDASLSHGITGPTFDVGFVEKSVDAYGETNFVLDVE